MSKEDFFSKLNIKDYDNQLEDILEGKSFSEGTKNILLNILYKMETDYEDYKKVKVQVASKKELLEEIIEIVQNNCNEIELIRPKLNERTKLGDEKYIVENDKIISYPNEKIVFYALNRLKKTRFILNNKYTIIKEPMEVLLNQGYIMDKDEILRDFDGWTWNIVQEEIENYIYNLLYQNIKILLGNDFLQTAMKYNEEFDFIAEFENILNEFNDEDKKNNIPQLMYQIAILENIKDDKEKKDDILHIKSELEDELIQLNNKKEYLQKIANSKKIIGKNIKDIDEKLNNNKLLRRCFVEENKYLSESQRIFSLSEYSEILQEKRKNLLQELEQYSQIMKPLNFVKRKNEIAKKCELLNDINFDIECNEEINAKLIELQKEFLNVLDEKFKNIQSKKEIIEYIYLFRYYKLIYVNKEQQIKDLVELTDKIRITEKHLITKACKLKAMNILCQDIENNYELVSKILSYNIIDLEDVSLEFKKHDKNIVLDIYDDNVLEDSIIYDNNEELSVKFNKKIKLFN